MKNFAPKTLEQWFNSDVTIVVPNIQRNFVWTEGQIEKLFDSIYRGYFIGLFWVWDNKKEIDKIGFWGIQKDFKKGDAKNSSTGKNIIAVADGQQRLTALSIGLYGSFEGKYLYFKCDAEIKDKNIFKFSSESLSEPWVKVGEILSNSKYTRKYKNTAGRLKDNITKNNDMFCFRKLVGDVSEVAEIFARLNKGGTPLTNNHILLAHLVKGVKDIRGTLDEIITDNNTINIDYDWLMSVLMFVSGESLRKNLENSDTIIKKINSRKEDGISLARVRNAVSLMRKKVNSLGFLKDKIVSKNALIPLVYMYYKDKNIASDEEIKKYLQIAFLTSVFGRSTQSVLTKIRTIMIETGDLRELFTEMKDFRITKDQVKAMLTIKKEDKRARVLLDILYDMQMGHGESAQLDIDHMHPRQNFSDEKVFEDILVKQGKKQGRCKSWLNQLENWKEKKEQIPNLAPLHEILNRGGYKKDTPLKNWIEEREQRGNSFKREKNFLNKNTSLALADFEKFFNMRKQKMTQKLKQYFGVK